MRIDCIRQLAESGPKRVFTHMSFFRMSFILKGAEYPPILLSWMGIEDTQHLKRQAPNFQNSPSQLHPQNLWFCHLCLQEVNYFARLMWMIAHAMPILHMLVPTWAQQMRSQSLQVQSRCLLRKILYMKGKWGKKPLRNPCNIYQIQWTN